MFTAAQTELYEKNLKLLMDSNPDLYHSVTQKNNVTGDHVEWVSESNNFTIQRGETTIFLHSRYNQERELRKVVERIGVSDKTVVLFGLGNGEILNILQERESQISHLVIVEPNQSIIRNFFHNYDFVDICQQFGKVSLIINKVAEEAAAWLSFLIANSIVTEQKVSVIALITYRTLYNDYYRAIAKAAVDAIRMNRVNFATIENFRFNWLVNYWRNLPYLSMDMGMFNNTFKGKPAILVSAGPSLKKNIHLLKIAYDRALIVAVGSAISILESHGIVPHFRVALDAAVENESLFKSVDTSACPLIYSEHLYFGVLPQYEGEKIHMSLFTHNSLSSYIFERLSLEHLIVRAGFSVANVALDLICKLGCSTIVLMGQDLCYTEGKLHAEGAWDEQIEERYMRPDIETEDIFGTKVYTDRPFLGMKKVMEKIIKIYSGVRFINSTEGGLPILGAPNKSFRDVLEKELVCSFDYRDAIQEVISSQNDQAEEIKTKVAEIVNEIADSVDSMMNANSLIIKQLRDMHHKINHTLKKYTIEKEIKNLHVKVTKLQNQKLYAYCIIPLFEQKFMTRRNAISISENDWRMYWTKEVEILLLEASEIQEYLELMHLLILEYKNEKKLEINFQ